MITKGNKWKRHSSGENRKLTGRVVRNQQRHKTRRSEITKYFHTGVTFILVLERILDKIRDKEGGVKISGTKINNLAFADDIDLIEEDAQRLEETTWALNKEGKRYGLNMNFEKTKTMVFGEKEPTGELLIDGRHLENVEQFTYLGSNTTYDLDQWFPTGGPRTAPVRGALVTGPWKNLKNYKESCGIIRFAVKCY